MALPTTPATRRARWAQGSIIGVSAVVIIFAGANLVSRDLKPTSETPPSAVPSITTAFSMSSEPPVPPVEPEPTADLVPAVVPATAVEAPTAATPAPANVTYENCRAVWDAIGRPINAGEPGYDEKLDSNHNGVGCEQDPR